MYLLHVRYPSGITATLTSPSAFLRGLTLIALRAQPVDLRLEDRATS
jgi:hypothetical protein